MDVAAKLRSHAQQMMAERVEEIDDDVLEDPSDLENDLHDAAKALDECAAFRAAGVRAAATISRLQAEIESKDTEIDALRSKILQMQEAFRNLRGVIEHWGGP